ncbi:MAG TPA: hypothetical protein GX507_08555 [Clostridia bacterium]|nr:hypothetical protein [Clostridia bacterium]
MIIERSARPDFSRYKDRGTVCAIGTFDGVHLGHRRILDMLLREAKARFATSVVMTFEPHPLEVLAPLVAPCRLTTLEEKARLIEEQGVQVLWAVPFTLDVATLDAERFVKTFIVETLGCKCVVVGFNFTFGHHGAGTAKDLERFGEKYGFDVKIVGAVRHLGMVVSSSMIRRLLSEGRYDIARALLGRPQEDARVPHLFTR